MSIPLFFLLACGGSAWDDVADCEALSAGERQDECWAATLPALFRTERERAESLATERITDPRVRDFVWLTVTRDIDPGSYRYCDKIEEEALATRCRVLVSRPHLHRELTGDAPRPGAGGGPPSADGPPPGRAPTGGDVAQPQSSSASPSGEAP